MSPTKPQAALVALGTKAETLQRLAPLVQKSKVKPLEVVSLGEWREAREAVLARLQDKVPGPLWAIRSSALCEDQAGASAAGAFTSLLGVPADDQAQIASAMDQVAASYPDLVIATSSPSTRAISAVTMPVGTAMIA